MAGVIWGTLPSHDTPARWRICSAVPVTTSGTPIASSLGERLMWLDPGWSGGQKLMKAFELDPGWREHWTTEWFRPAPPRDPDGRFVPRP